MNNRRTTLLVLFLVLILSLLFAFFVSNKEGMDSDTKKIFNSVKKYASNEIKTMKTKQKTNGRLKGTKGSP